MPRFKESRMNDTAMASSSPPKLYINPGRNLALEVERLRAQVNRLRNRPDWIDLATLRTYEDMLESRLRLLEATT